MPFNHVPRTSVRKAFWLLPVVLAVAVVLLVGSTTTMSRSNGSPPSAAAAATHEPGTRPTTIKHLVALGDSVTSGYGCDCASFPQLYGKDLSQVRGWSTSVDNLGVNGMDSAGLLKQLDDPKSHFDAAVTTADIVVLTIGANDFSPSHDAVTDGDCVADGATECVDDELTEMRKNVSAILNRIGELRNGDRTAVLVTGYWNVFEGGDVARSLYPAAGVKATHELTRHVNSVLQSVAVAAGDTYVDLFTPFNGPASHGNVTTLLASDGDHPNAAGHALIADRLIAAGLHGLVLE